MSDDNSTTVPVWEPVCPSAHRPGTMTRRLEVPGGWLYKDGEALAFVPFPGPLMSQLLPDHPPAVRGWSV